MTNSPNQISLSSFVSSLIIGLILVSGTSCQGASPFDQAIWGQWNWTSWTAGPPCPTQYNPAPFQTVKSSVQVQGAIKQLDGKIRDFMQLFTRQGINTSLSIGLVYGQDILWTNNYGSTMPNNSIPPTINTIYRLGSITKIFTSLMLAQATMKNVASLDDPLSKFFNANNPPEFSIFNPFSVGESDILLHMLSSQSSGVPREPPCGLFPSTQCTEEIIFEILSQLELFFPPYSNAHYSNLGLALLGRALERAFGQKYEDFVVQKIFYPLKMYSSGFYFNETVKSRMALGTTYQNGKQIPDVTWDLENGWPSPAGGSWSSVSDMMEFIKFLLRTNSTADSPILSDSKKVEYLLPGYMNKNGATNYGLYTWENVFANEENLNTKGGLLGGYGSSIALSQQLQFGVFAVFNFMSGSIDQVTTDAMNLVLPVLKQINQQNQPTPPIYPQINDLLGNYGVNGQTYISLLQSEKTPLGVYRLTVIGSPVEYNAWYAPEMNVNGYITFYYKIVQPVPMSCLILTGLGDGATAIFANGTVTLPDAVLYQVPKL